MGQTFGYSEGDLPVTEDISGRLLRLPMYYDITQEEQASVVEKITSYLTDAPSAVVPAGLVVAGSTN